MDNKQSKKFKKELARKNDRRLKEMRQNTAAKKKAASRSRLPMPEYVPEDQDYQPESSRLDELETKISRHRSKKRKKKAFSMVFVILILVGLFASGLAGLYFQKMGRLDRTLHFKDEDVVINEEVKEATINSSMAHFRNIALFGVDSRSQDISVGSQSDTIIIASVNEDTKEVKLVSILRDSYLNNARGGFDKATDVFSKYGPKGVIDMLNKNLDLNITDYVAVNFACVVDVVDALGGLDLTVRDDEWYMLSDYAYCNAEILGYDQPDRLEGPGDYHLNGLQVLGYCRIRYTNGLDMERAQRQRTVMNLILQKAKKSDLLTLNSVVDAALPNIATSLTNTEILDLAKDVASYSLVTSAGFPYHYMFFSEFNGIGDCTVPTSLTLDVRQLHADLFGDDGYNPSAIVRDLDTTIQVGIYDLGDIRQDSEVYESYNQNLKSQTSDTEVQEEEASGYEEPVVSGETDGLSEENGESSDFDLETKTIKLN